MSVLLQVEDLQIGFKTPFGRSRALRGLTFSVAKGQIFGLVGESGCGKSMTGRAILGILPKGGSVDGGRILFGDQELTALSQTALRGIRGERIAMIFQNPGTALNPVFTVGEQMQAIMKQHGMGDNTAIAKRIRTLLADVGLPDPDALIRSYPHQLSGGMQQRVMIAIALCSEPELLIADEPTTALDVTIQAQILELLVRLKRERDLTILLITHDMGVVAETCDQVAVLYAGRAVEQGSVEQMFSNPVHPYTQGLLAALPTPNARGQALQVIPGAVPDGLTPISGCAFADRCPWTFDLCQIQRPAMQPVAADHESACFLLDVGSGTGGEA